MNSRQELSRLFDGEGVELGVAAGLFSAVILDNWRVKKLHSIDAWTERGHDDAEMRAALDRLTPFKNRSRVLRSTFEDAESTFAESSLDFVYIDGFAHTGQDSGKTLADWWPKLKSGGIFAGHDYCAAWQPTVDAVDAFLAARGLTNALQVTGAGDQFPSWWVVKP